VWSAIRNNTYYVKFKSLRFDAGNNFAGTITVSQVVHLTHHGNDAESTGTVELSAPSETLIASGC